MTNEPSNGATGPDHDVGRGPHPPGAAWTPSMPSWDTARSPTPKYAPLRVPPPPSSTPPDDPKLTAIKDSRQQVYGPPRENHEGIAQMWASILQPWAPVIARCDPLPPHIIALLMTLLKINRMRLVFHEDNYDDASIYLSFARSWQPSAPPVPPP